jgi:hypothetical protein
MIRKSLGKKLRSGADFNVKIADRPCLKATLWMDAISGALLSLDFAWEIAEKRFETSAAS